MADSRGNWSEIDVAGHACQRLRAPAAKPARLHSHLSALQLVGQARRLPGLHARVRSPRPARDRAGDGPKLVDRSHLAEFDPKISAERYVLDRVVPYVAERWNARPPQLALLGVSMGGQGALRMAYKHPNVFPTVAAISPAIDFQKRIDEGVDPGLDYMYRDAEDARQDTATLHIHPLNWPRNQFFCCDPTDYRWHDSVRPAANETLVARRAVRMRPGNRSRRPQLRVRLAHGAASGRLPRRATRARAAPRGVTPPNSAHRSFEPVQAESRNEVDARAVAADVQIAAPDNVPDQLDRAPRGLKLRDDRGRIQF